VTRVWRGQDSQGGRRQGSTSCRLFFVTCKHFPLKPLRRPGIVWNFFVDFHLFITYDPDGERKVKSMKLTRRQKEILDYLTEFIDREGYSPSMEEIAAHFQIASLNAVFKHLAALEERGYLHRDANRARSIELTRSDLPPAVMLPLLGAIAAGRPIEAVSSPETLTVPEDLLPGPGAFYVLRVQGESMIDEHIRDGDYVVVDSRAQAENGKTVVALIDNENVTLKKLYHEGSRVRLQPANPDIEPLLLDASRIKVQGVVVAVMRKYR
jgi:repressor LexA